MKALLINPNCVKENTAVDYNVAGEYLVVAIREAQEIDLVETIGSKLYNKLSSLVIDGTINLTVNSKYKELLDDYVTSFLMYAAEARLMPIVAYKVANAGVVTTDDTHINNVEYDAVRLLQQEAVNKRNVYKKRLQDHLCKHYSEYDEFKNWTLDDVHQQLYSSSDCGVWLGGVRGKVRR